MKNFNLENFQNTWEMVLSGMKKLPDEEILELLYFERIEKHQGLAEVIAHYSRLPEHSGGDRSLAFLQNAVARQLQRARQKSVREEISKHIAGGGAPAAPATDGGKGGGKGSKGKKGKDKKGGSRGNSAPLADVGKRACHFLPQGTCKSGKS